MKKAAVSPHRIEEIGERLKQRAQPRTALNPTPPHPISTREINFFAVGFEFHDLSLLTIAVNAELNGDGESSGIVHRKQQV